MKAISKLTNLLILLVMVLGLCLLLDWAANHDILNDYASKGVINRFMPDKANLLPEWTNTSGEWMIIHISYLIQVAVSITIFVILLKLKKRITEQQ
jgi:hypothetical protein